MKFKAGDTVKYSFISGFEDIILNRTYEVEDVKTCCKTEVILLKGKNDGNTTCAICNKDLGGRFRNSDLFELKNSDFVINN